MRVFVLAIVLLFLVSTATADTSDDSPKASSARAEAPAVSAQYSSKKTKYDSSKKCSDICYLCRKKCGKGLVGHLSCACPYGTLCCVPPHKHPSPYKYPKYPPYKKV
ncbi:uncharacterized protein LOC143835130 [Paroedura picta]|uniref:uncharacterized protein LOC143835130 n=1 Tax=Paroedura picta TaxID=143630 RepID=UPI00405634D4